jgi:hypothetical protein
MNSIPAKLHAASTMSWRRGDTVLDDSRQAAVEALEHLGLSAEQP